MREKLFFNLIKNVKKSVRKARKNGFFSCKNEEKAGEKERLYFNSERWNAGLSEGKGKFLKRLHIVANKKEKKFNDIFPFVKV
ncbi:hypothetical protein ACFYKT_13450 [Cytobacillus sp. FJAT-53684]|uniref:Uncharacterized protein n=1 Tax=Cytobacillus mangrovibacter TaxID=3299024 RepID=A0ABW6K0S1_9BACI